MRGLWCPNPTEPWLNQVPVKPKIAIISIANQQAPAWAKSYLASEIALIPHQASPSDCARPLPGR
jgi:hypothetical protein